MNSIAHAYSVVAFLLILGSTLLGSPQSVFSESNTKTMVAGATTVAKQLATQATGTPAAVVTSDSETDSYPREKLGSDQTFTDFVVGPGRFSIELSPGESKVVEVIISNRMGERKRFSFETEDMTGSSDPAQAVVLLGNQQGPYTLRDYIKIPHKTFYLNNGERVRVPVTVSLPADAEPGGRYGSLLVSIVSDPNKLEPTNGARPGSVVVSRIGTLFFVTTPGKIEQNLELKSFGAINNQKFFTKGPISFGLVSENKGSVHTTPYGEVRLFNMMGNEVGFVELEPWFVMPKSLRLREVTWNRDFLLGRYTAVAKINRGYDDIVDEKTFTFWVIPMQLLGGVFIGLFILFLFFYFIISRFEFKRKAS